MKNNGLFHILLFLMLMALTASCGGSKLPEGIMDEGEMVEFLTDAHLLAGYYSVESNYRLDEVSKLMEKSYDELLEKYHITRDDYNRSMEYYTHHEIQLGKIYEQVDSKLAEME